MPQLDKEIFIEYFLYIFIILMQIFSNESISESFLRINTRWFLLNTLMLKKSLFKNEIMFVRQIYKISK
jgi:hypothetical protein